MVLALGFFTQALDHFGRDILLPFRENVDNRFLVGWEYFFGGHSGMSSVIIFTVHSVSEQINRSDCVASQVQPAAPISVVSCIPPGRQQWRHPDATIPPTYLGHAHAGIM